MKKLIVFLPLLLFAGSVKISVIVAQTTFGSQQVIIEPEVRNVQAVYAADLDNDGDLDVMSASAYDGKIAWYENLLGSVGVEDIQTKPRLFSLYPNPSGSSTYIQIEPSAIQGQTIELNWCLQMLRLQQALKCEPTHLHPVAIKFSITHGRIGMLLWYI
ncbi:MAG: VCBS repeat-containing protein [Saprospiraceae bacterium]|nr:VCBS repeat-containing protein [Saprospiraceae bacterium]